MVLGILRRRKALHLVLSSYDEIREHLDWARERKIPLAVLGEGSPKESSLAQLLQVNHAREDAYLLIQFVVRSRTGLFVKKGESLNIEYELNRGCRYSFQSFPVSEVDPGSGIWRIGYPDRIDSFQDRRAVRYKSVSMECIPVDLEKDRGVVVDIGFHGLKFTSNRVFEKGTLLRNLRFELPRYGLVQGSAVVKYMRPSTEYPLWRYLCGVEFTGMRSRDQKRINRYVNHRMRRR